MKESSQLPIGAGDQLVLRIVERHTAVKLVKEKIGFGGKLLE